MRVLQGVEFVLPIDVTCTYDLESNDVCCQRPLNTSCCSPSRPCVPDDGFGADIGPRSRTLFAAALQGSATVFWNGPMGRYERAAFAAGTEAVAHGVAAATRVGATTIVGGAACFVPCMRMWARGIRGGAAQGAWATAQARAACRRHKCMHVRIGICRG